MDHIDTTKIDLGIDRHTLLIQNLYQYDAGYMF